MQQFIASADPVSFSRLSKSDTEPQFRCIFEHFRLPEVSQLLHRSCTVGETGHVPIAS